MSVSSSVSIHVGVAVLECRLLPMRSWRRPSCCVSEVSRPALNDILDAAGSPRGSLYFHFPRGNGNRRRLGPCVLDPRENVETPAGWPAQCLSLAAAGLCRSPGSWPWGSGPRRSPPARFTHGRVNVGSIFRLGRRSSRSSLPRHSASRRRFAAGARIPLFPASGKGRSSAIWWQMQLRSQRSLPREKAVAASPAFAIPRSAHAPARRKMCRRSGQRMHRARRGLQCPWPRSTLPRLRSI